MAPASRKELFWWRLKEAKKLYGVAKQRPHTLSVNIDMVRLARIRNEYTVNPVAKHPIKEVIDSWNPAETIFIPPVERFVDQREDAAVTRKWIDTKDTFFEMIEALKNYEEISVDMEMSIHDHGYFGPYNCLLQISSFDTDYVIDVLALAIEMYNLRQILQNGDIVKIFHGSTNDLLSLQFEHNIFCYPVIDTQLVYAVVKDRKSIALDSFVKEYLSVEMSKTAQLADFSMRPLSNGLFNYARSDSHLLLRAWQNFKEAFFPHVKNRSQQFMDFVQLSKKNMLAMKVVKCSPDPWDFYCHIEGDKCELFSQIFCLRERMARHFDVKRERVVSNEHLYKVVNKLVILA